MPSEGSTPSASAKQKKSRLLPGLFFVCLRSRNKNVDATACPILKGLLSGYKAPKKGVLNASFQSKPREKARCELKNTRKKICSNIGLKRDDWTQNRAEWEDQADRNDGKEKVG